MNDPEPFDGLDHHLSERMERAVGGLGAPDVVPAAMARGRRQRTHRRLSYGAAGLAAATALVLTVPALADDWAGPDSSDTPVAADPAPTTPPPTTPTTPTTAAPGTGGAAHETCADAATGWWSTSTAQIEAHLAGLLPEGIRAGRASASQTGVWEGNLVVGGDAQRASITLLPPPGVLGPFRTIEEVSRLGPCGGGANEPAQPVKPCDEITGDVDGSSEEQTNVVSCEEIRSENGGLVGVLVEQTQLAVVDGQDQPTDQTYLTAVAAGPEGGHVELVVGDTLTKKQASEIVSDPAWTNG